MPQRRFCSAKASANTSRPQPFAADIGVRKKPKAERGPKPISEMRQPHRMMTAGVRHVIERAVAASWLMGHPLLRCRMTAGQRLRCASPPDPTKNCDPIDLLFAWLRRFGGLAIGRDPCYIRFALIEDKPRGEN